MNEVNSDYESCLVILVPEAEPVVSPFRQKYDPSASQGMPAHITINYPFSTKFSSRQGLLKKLKSLFAKYPPIQFDLLKINWFPGVLYLEPVPAFRLIELIRAVEEEFPESPPYDGQYSKIIPHLTVAQFEDCKLFNEVNLEFRKFSQGLLPIKVTIETVFLMDNKDGSWTVRKKFKLIGPTSERAKKINR